MDKQVQETYASDDVRNIPLLDRVQELKDDILAGGDEAQNLRRLPDETVKTLVDKGLFRFALPKELGGDVVPTVTVLACTSLAPTVTKLFAEPIPIAPIYLAPAT